MAQKKKGWENDPEGHSIVGHGSEIKRNLTVGFTSPGVVVPQKTIPTSSKIDLIADKVYEKILQKMEKEGQVKAGRPKSISEAEQKTVFVKYNIKSGPEGWQAIKNAKGEEYFIPVYETLPNTPEYIPEHRHYVKDKDMIFFDININDTFTVMDVVLANLFGVDLAELNKLIKEKKYKEAEELIRKGKPKNILLVGPTGTGKTTFAKYLAWKMNVPFARIPLSKITVDDLLGHYEVHEGQMIWRDGILTEAVRRGWLVLLDEINAAKPDVLFALHTLTDEDRRLYLLAKAEVVSAHPNFRLISAMNVGEAYTGTSRLNAAFLDRFEIIPVGYITKEEEWEILKKKHGVKPPYEIVKEKNASLSDMATSIAAGLILEIAEASRELKEKAEKTGGYITGVGNDTLINMSIQAEDFVPLSTRRVEAWVDTLKTYFKVQEERGEFQKFKGKDLNKFYQYVADVVDKSMDFEIKSHFIDPEVMAVITSQLRTKLNEAEAQKINELYPEAMREAIRKCIEKI